MNLPKREIWLPAPELGMGASCCFYCGLFHLVSFSFISPPFSICYCCHFFFPHFPHFLSIVLAWSLVVLKHTGRCIRSVLSQRGPPQTPSPSTKICSCGPTVYSLREPSWIPPAHTPLQASERTKPACIQAGGAGPRCDLIMSL